MFTDDVRNRLLFRQLAENDDHLRAHKRDLFFQLGQGIRLFDDGGLDRK